MYNDGALIKKVQKSCAWTVDTGHWTLDRNKNKTNNSPYIHIMQQK